MLIILRVLLNIFEGGSTSISGGDDTGVGTTELLVCTLKKDSYGFDFCMCLWSDIISMVFAVVEKDLIIFEDSMVGVC